MEQIKSLEIDSCTYGQLVFDKGVKNTQWGKGSLFRRWCWENWTFKLDPCLTPLKK